VTSVTPFALAYRILLPWAQRADGARSFPGALFGMPTIIRLLSATAVLALALAAGAQTLPSPSNNPAPSDKGKPAPTDKRLSGAISVDRVNADLEKAAMARHDSAKGRAEFGRWYYFYYSLTQAEFSALAKHTVFLIVVLTQKSEELPLKRVYIREKDRDVALARLSGSRSELDGQSLEAQMFGRFREDGLYLVPMAPMVRDGQIQIDFAANRAGYVMMQFPSNVAREDIKTRPWLDGADPPPNARPDLMELQAFIRRKYPGFPVPTSLP
jgi:hypothetical protein